MNAGTLAGVSVPDVVAVFAVVAPSAVAIAAIIVGYKQQSRGLAHERQLSALDNVRDVIDQAAMHLHHVASALDMVRQELGQRQYRFFAEGQGEDVYEELRQAGDEFDVLRERLAVRLGEEHEAVGKITEADEAVLAIFRKPRSVTRRSRRGQIRPRCAVSWSCGDAGGKFGTPILRVPCRFTSIAASEATRSR